MMYPLTPVTHYALTSPQREIWFDQILHETVPMYNIGGYVKISGYIDPVLFEQAVNLLIQQHDVLRTILTASDSEDGLPTQGFVEELAVTVPINDFSAQPNAEYGSGCV